MEEENRNLPAVTAAPAGKDRGGLGLHAQLTPSPVSFLSPASTM